MEVKWCWRCKCDIPMLNDDEYKVAFELYKKGFGRGSESYEDRFADLLKYYEEVTGVEGRNPNAIMHHAISLYGIDCPSCSKPLRTKNARYCVACGFGKEEFQNGDERPLEIRMKK